MTIPTKWLLPLTAIALLGACASIRVLPLEDAPESLCVMDNPRVLVNDFLPVLQAGFFRHGITTTVVSSPSKDECPNLVTYTARRSWDGVPYLSTAEILIINEHRQVIARGNYRLRGRGGFSPSKFEGTKEKMDPVIDEMLRSIKPRYTNLEILKP